MKTIRNILAYIPRRLHVAWILLFFVPAIAFADPTTSGGILEYLQSMTNGLSKAKSFMWVMAALVGTCVAVWGLIMLAIIHTTSDYRGKHTKTFCIKMIVIGAIVASGSTLYGMVAHTFGASDAIANSTGDGYNGL